MSRNEAVHARDFTQKRRASPEGNTAKSAALLEQQMATTAKPSMTLALYKRPSQLNATAFAFRS
jgi:hypothetical protein